MRMYNIYFCQILFKQPVFLGCGVYELNFSSSVIRQKGESRNGCFKKRKHGKFSEKRIFLTLIRTRTCVCVSGGKKCWFFGKFGVLYFLETAVLRFALLPYYRRFHLYPRIEYNLKWAVLSFIIC